MKITLTAIIGNEAHIIERFVKSFSPLVDHFVFVRAIGNKEPDATVSIIESVCEKPFTISEYHNSQFPHVDNFGAARQKALDIARSGISGDFIMWADADDVLADGACETIKDALQDFPCDVMILPYHVRGDKQIVMRERLFRKDVPAQWKFAIHEQLAFGRDVTYRIIQAPILHDPISDKSSSHDRNVAILDAQLADTGRNLFYLAQEYFQTGKFKQFVSVADIALQLPLIGAIERYELLLQVAQVDKKRSKSAASEAFALMPDRREAIALLTNYAIIDKEYDKALLFSRIMRDTPLPTVTYWSQNNEWYGWKANELHRQVLRLNGYNQNAKLSFDQGINTEKLTFSIIHATLDRPYQALAIREMWLSRAKHPENVQYIFGCHAWDTQTIETVKGYEHTITSEKGSAWNYDTAAGLATGDVIIQAQDDCYPPQDWDVELAKLIPFRDQPVFVAVSDGHRNDLLSVNTIMTRAYMDIKASRDKGENGFFHRGYVTVFPDTENSYRALQDRDNGVCEYVYAPEFVIYHDHPCFNASVPYDETYAWENAPENYAKGNKLFLERNPNAKESDFSLNRLGKEVASWQ